MLNKLLGYRSLSRFNKLLMLVGILFWVCLLLAYLATQVNPNSVAWLAFMGLGYPVLFIVNLLFLVYWGLKKHRQFWWFAVVMLLGFSLHRNFIQISTTTSGTENSIKVMSYNVRLFDLYNWTENWQTKNEILNLIANENPDILCLQEFYNDSSDNQFRMIDTLLDVLGTQYYHESYMYKIRNQQFGMAMFSKYPVINTGRVAFPKSPGNNCIFVDALIGNDTVRIYNAHLGSIGFKYADYEFVGGKGYPKWPSEKAGEQQILERLSNGFKNRANQVNTLLANMDSCNNEILLCCDLNDIPVSYSYARLAKKLNDAFTEGGNGIGSTYIGNFPFLRIDYIMHSSKIKVLDFNTVDNELSDHRPITCILELE